MQVGAEADFGGGLSGTTDGHRIDDFQRAQIGWIGINRAVRLDRPAGEIEAGGILQIAVGVRVEAAGTGEGDRIGGREAAGVFADDKEAVTGDGEIGCRGAGGEQAGFADLQLGRTHDAARGELLTAALGAVERRENGAGALVSDGIHIGDIVGNGREGAGICDQAGCAGDHG